ncbi:hypothetical protein SAMN05216176_11792 [Nitratireductor indicus]|nr:hypothetical protein SAMN05216176_11792 [Nitratireductor indicus]
MRLLHGLLALFHARRAQRHSTLYRWHMEQRDARLRSARKIAGRRA